MRELTKNAIADTMKKLLESKLINQITVKDICAECSINRQTFYYYFQDIYDLCFWIMERDLKDHIESFHSDRSDIYAYLRTLFEFFIKNSRQVRHAYDSVNRIQYESLFRERAKPLIEKRLLSYEESKTVTREDIDFIASFYTMSLSGLLIKWIEEGLPDEYHVALDKYCILMDGSMRTLLLKFSAK